MHCYNLTSFRINRFDIFVTAEKKSPGTLVKSCIFSVTSFLTINFQISNLNSTERMPKQRLKHLEINKVHINILVTQNSTLMFSS